MAEIKYPITIVNICNMALRNAGLPEITALADVIETAKALSTYYDTLLRKVLEAHDWGFARKRTTLTGHSLNPLFGYTYQYQLPADCIRVRAIEDQDTADWTVEGRKLLADSSTCLIKYTSYHPSTEFDFAAFTGTGVDDAEYEGAYNLMSGTTTYRVKIDGVATGTGGVDTFTWSDTNGSSWNLATVDIDGKLQALNNGMSIVFGATTGHTATDYWVSECRASTYAYPALFVEAFSVRLASMLMDAIKNSKTGAQKKMEEYFIVLNEARAVDSQEGMTPSMVANDWTNSRL